MEKCLPSKARRSMSVIVGVDGALEGPLTDWRHQSPPVFRLIGLNVIFPK